MSQNKYLFEWLATDHYRELDREREQIHRSEKHAVEYGPQFSLCE